MHALENKGYHQKYKMSGGHTSANDGTVRVKFKGKWYARKAHWKDLGNYEGYPYIILFGKKYGLKED